MNIVVTGDGSGIGAAVARILHRSASELVADGLLVVDRAFAAA